MKYLMITKGGNTEIAVGEALKAGEQEGAETELIRSTDYNTRPCDGCLICRETRSVLSKTTWKRYRKVAGLEGGT